jgi:hypothetical protein
VKEASCAKLAEFHSAFVDGALSDADRELMLRHLVACARCRAEVEELRGIRKLLNQSGSSRPAAPGDLSMRLVSIAGSEAGEPLWTRPFRRSHPARGFGAGLPRRSRMIRVRATAAIVALGSAVGAVSVVGYAAAPSATVASVSDPGSEARAAFTSTLGQSPLSSDVLGAVNLANLSDLGATSAIVGKAPTVAAGAALGADAALDTMRYAADASGSVSYDGRQRFTAFRDGSVMAADAEIEARAGQGRQVRVVNQTGERLIEGFSPATIGSRVVDNELLALLEQNYTLAGRRGAIVAGRAATVVIAMRAGTVAARWWIDDDTGVLLWHETYDETGSAELSFGFTRINIIHAAGIIDHFPRRLVVPNGDVALTLSNTPRLEAAGWTCPTELAGLSLMRLRSNSTTDPTGVQLGYTDGLVTVTVFEQRGRLAVAPEGASWDPGLKAYIWHGASEAATWQSGDTVFTVVTDGSEALLATAVDALPHEDSRPPSTMDQIKAGWVKILADVRG